MRIVTWLGEVGARWGLPVDACRVHAVLYLAAEPIHATQLAPLLGLNAEETDRALDWLLEQGLVTSSDGTWRTGTDPWALMLRALEGRRSHELREARAVIDEWRRMRVDQDHRVSRQAERLFDLVVRFLPEYRQDVDAISNILVNTPDGARIPLKQVATITTQTGAFIIYRENNERYIPIKFSVRDRDLESTVEEAQTLLAKTVTLPERYRMEWAGQYDQLKDEQKRLAKIVPLSLLLILLLLYITFDSLKNALLVLSAVPFALIGGVIALVATHTNFSISAAVGIISTLGVAILGGVLLISRIEDGRQAGLNLREAIMQAAAVQMRPILMATVGAAIGLLPAALATGIGSQAQKPLARVVVGGMLTAAFLILVVLPVLYEMVHRRGSRE